MSAADVPPEAAPPVLAPLPPSAESTAPSTPALSTSEDDPVPLLRIEIPETNGNPFEGFTKFIESLVKHMEENVWKHDPDADIFPTMLPYLFKPPEDGQSDAFLTQLLYLLSIGLQGQVFEWKYKMLYEVHWNESRKGYMAELTSIKRVGAGEFPKPRSEARLAPPTSN